MCETGWYAQARLVRRQSPHTSASQQDIVHPCAPLLVAVKLALHDARGIRAGAAPLPLHLICLKHSQEPPPQCHTGAALMQEASRPIPFWSCHCAGGVRAGAARLQVA